MRNQYGERKRPGSWSTGWVAWVPARRDLPVVIRLQTRASSHLPMPLIIPCAIEHRRVSNGSYADQRGQLLQLQRDQLAVGRLVLDLPSLGPFASGVRSPMAPSAGRRSRFFLPPEAVASVRSDPIEMSSVWHLCTAVRTRHRRHRGKDRTH